MAGTALPSDPAEVTLDATNSATHGSRHGRGVRCSPRGRGDRPSGRLLESQESCRRNGQSGDHRIVISTSALPRSDGCRSPSVLACRSHRKRTPNDWFSAAWSRAQRGPAESVPRPRRSAPRPRCPTSRHPGASRRHETPAGDGSPTASLGCHYVSVHSIRSWATARSGASAGASEGGAAAAGFRGNSRAGATRTESPSSQAEPYGACVVRSKEGRRAEVRTYPSRCASYTSASGRDRP
jgi:hypothetical protein